jgi:predicted class III extradiol MEMO1 family dioxygenase
MSAIGRAIMGAIRPPAVAGSFYPADAARLRAMVDGFVAEAGGHADQAPKTLVAPHAGYVYSGPTAGCAFAAISPKGPQIHRVVVIGPAHFVPIRGLAVPSAEAFRTPLGDVPLDREAIAAIRGLPQVLLADAPHAPEHALEVELPDGPDTLIVISSDLSHYEPYARAREHDAATAVAIERFDHTALGPRDACGHLPIAGLLIEARRRRMQIERLDLRSSGDTAGPKDQVVGYGAWALCEARPGDSR